MEAGAIKRGVLAAAVAVAGLCLAVLLSASSPRAEADQGELLLPDLVTLKPDGLQVTNRARVRRLRLDNTIGNTGVGPLEIYGQSDGPADCNADGDGLNDLVALQRIYEDGAGGTADIFERDSDTGFTESNAGCRVFHPRHDHWHFNDFARYSLVREKTGKVRATSVKVSFCVIDTGRLPLLPGQPASPYYPASPKLGCDEASDQGLSIGWSDTYSAPLPGQFINLGKLPRGRYCLSAVADPADRLEELDENNNERLTAIWLDPASGKVHRIHRPCRL